MRHLFSLTILALVAVSSGSALAAKDCSVSGQSRSATIAEGKRFSVAVEGNGPDIILIPGLGTPRAVWAETVDALAGCYTIHSIQLRGFGDDAGVNATGPVLDPFVHELADYIDDEIVNNGRKPPVIVGHSMGGLAGLKIAHGYPQLVLRLIMVDSLPSFAVLIPGMAGADPDAIEAVAGRMRQQIALSYGKPADPATIEASVKDMTLKQENLPRMREWSAAADPRVVAQVVYEDIVIDMRPKLGEVTVPVTVLAAWHAGMPFSESQTASFFERQFAGTPMLKVATIAGSAHFIMLDQPAAFEVALRAGLAD
ncbi:MAG: alpha/beta hydrolase [Erythrobacter sp.]|nr:alpha/beta hydrolase [Erythrobacter sp.]